MFEDDLMVMVSFRAPKSVLAAIDRLASERKKNRSEVVREALALVVPPAGPLRRAD